MISIASAFVLTALLAPALPVSAVQKDLTFSLADGRTLKFDLYRRPETSAAVPLVVFINTGREGFKEGDQSKFWGEVIARRGLAMVSYDSVPGQARPVYEAILQHLQRSGERLGIDASRVVIFAVSGNASLGLPLAMDPSRKEVRAAVIYYGGPRQAHFRSDVPVLIVRAGLDQPMLNRSLDANIADALAANAPWMVIGYGTGRHGFDLFDKNASTDAVVTATTEFMAAAVSSGVRQAIVSTSGDASAAAALYRRDGPAAVEAYSALASARPTDNLVHQRLAEACIVAKDYPCALKAVERSRELGNGRRGELGFAGAQAAAGIGDIDRLIEYLKLVPAVWPLDELLAEPVFHRVREDQKLKDFLKSRK